MLSLPQRELAFEYPSLVDTCQYNPAEGYNLSCSDEVDVLFDMRDGDLAEPSKGLGTRRTSRLTPYMQDIVSSIEFLRQRNAPRESRIRVRSAHHAVRAALEK